MPLLGKRNLIKYWSAAEGGMWNVVLKNLKFFFGRPVIKGEVVPLLGKWILTKYWSATEGGHLNYTFFNYIK